MAGEQVFEAGFAVRCLAAPEPLVSGPESDSASWTTHHAIAGLAIQQTPARDVAGVARLMLALWPELVGGAVEVRWLAEGGRVSCALLARVSAAEEGTARDECEKRLEAIQNLAQSLMRGWKLAPLGAHSLDEMLDLEGITDCGDLLRREIDVELSDGEGSDVPLLFGVDPAELSMLVESLSKCEGRVLLSLAAAPCEIDAAQREVLHGELVALEQALAHASVVDLGSAWADDSLPPEPSARVRAAASILQHRVSSLERVGFLRVSVASTVPLPLSLLIAAQEALAATPVTLDWVPAVEPADVEIFTGNLQTIGFTPWGVQAHEQAGHETVNDCYLASLEEVVTELVVPLADGFLPLTHTMVDPIPRAVPKDVPSSGRIIGCGAINPSRRVALAEADRLRHTYLVGQTGTGKSTMLLNLALADIAAGQGLCVIDPHGDLVDGILTRYPDERTDDLVLFDPTRTDRMVGLNPLEASTPTEQDFIVQQLIGMLYRIYDPGHTGIIGPRFEQMLRNAALVSMVQPDGGALSDLTRLFTDERFLARSLQNVSDPAVRAFWIDEQGMQSDFHKSEVLGWFNSKFGAFNTNTTMRHILSQRTSTIDVGDIMENGKVLLVKLPRGVLGEINAMWLGMILISKLQMKALSRANLKPEDRRLFNLYVDEFQNFAQTDFDSLVAEARKYGLALTLANQHIGQLTPEIRSAIIGNVASWLVFRVGLTDAELLADDIEGFSARDLTRLENYRCVVRTSISGMPVPAFDVSTLPPTGTPDSAKAEALAQASMMKYGRPAEEIEAEYLERWKPAGTSAEPHDYDEDLASALEELEELERATEEPEEDRPLGAGADPEPSRGPDRAMATGKPTAPPTHTETADPDQAPDIPRLLAKWNVAVDGGDVKPAVHAGCALADAYAATGRADEALVVLEQAMSIVGPDSDGDYLRDTLATQAARCARPEDTRRVMLLMAKMLFAEGFRDPRWLRVHSSLRVLDAGDNRHVIAECFSQFERLADDGEPVDWELLDQDPVLAGDE